MTVAVLIWLSASTAKSDGGHSWSDEDRTTLQRYNRLRALEGRFQRFDSETDEAFMSRQYSARASELGIENTQGERFEEFKKKVDEAAKKVNDSAHGLLSRIESAGSTMASGVSNAQEKTKRSVSSAAEGAKERLSEGASALKHQGDWVADGATALHNANPLAIGAVAIAAGALLGGLIPNTRFENETMGRSADWAKSKASEAVGEAVDAAGAEAEKAGERMNKRT
jgi:ElaB/YqjD/DUF883 family membrane-anchored ribosome-binding protein